MLPVSRVGFVLFNLRHPSDKPCDSPATNSLGKLAFRPTKIFNRVMQESGGNSGRGAARFLEHPSDFCPVDEIRRGGAPLLGLAVFGLAPVGEFSGRVVRQPEPLWQPVSCLDEPPP